MADQFNHISTILLHSLHAYHTWFVSSHPQGRAETFSGALLEEKDGCQLDMERVYAPFFSRGVVPFLLCPL